MVLSRVGSTLREERLRRKFSLEHVSNVTRISARYLEAIENNHPGVLPGIVFTRGFVRQYARFLDIPDEALLSQLPKVDIENAALPAPPDKQRRPFWIPSTIRRFIKYGSLAATVGIVTFAWVHFGFTPVFEQASRSALRSTLTKITEHGAQAVPVRPLSAPPRTAPQEEAARAPVQQHDPQPPAAADTATAAAVSAIQVLLTAKANAWVQVTADGRSAFVGLLHANDSREISGNQLVKVMTGNAGGLEISLNGKMLEPIGPEGQVRTVRLTAEGPLPDPKTPASLPDPL